MADAGVKSWSKKFKRKAGIPNGLGEGILQPSNSINFPPVIESENTPPESHNNGQYLVYTTFRI